MDDQAQDDVTVIECPLDVALEQPPGDGRPPLSNPGGGQPSRRLRDAGALGAGRLAVHLAIAGRKV
jgi:hypothetical protein